MLKVWTGLGLTNNWTDDDNWSDSTKPVLNDDVMFDSTSIKNCIIDAVIDIGTGNLIIDSGYTGTITQSNILTCAILTGSDGIFTGGANLTCTNLIVSGISMTLASTIDINGQLLITSGSLVLTSGTTYVSGGITGIFTHNSGTVILDGAQTIDTSSVFNNLNFSVGGTYTLLQGITIDSTFTFGIHSLATTINGYMINANGDITQNTGGGNILKVDGTTVIYISGSSNQSIYLGGFGNDSNYLVCTVIVNSSGGTVTFTNDVHRLSSFKYSMGTVDFGTSTIRVCGTESGYLGAFTFYNLIFGAATKTINLDGNVEVDNDFSFASTALFTLYGYQLRINGDYLGLSNAGFIGGNTTKIVINGTADQTLTIGGSNTIVNSIDIEIDSSGGTVYFTNSYHYIGGSFTNIAGAIDFASNTSTIVLAGYDGARILDSFTFYNFAIWGGSFGVVTLSASITVDNDFIVGSAYGTCTGTINGFDVHVKGDITESSSIISTISGTTIFYIDGTGAQSIYLPSYSGDSFCFQCKLVVNKASDTLTFITRVDIGELEFQAGNVDLGTCTLYTNNDVTISGGNLDFGSSLWVHAGGDYIYVAGTVNTNANTMVFYSTCSIDTSGISFYIVKFNAMPGSTLIYTLLSDMTITNLLTTYATGAYTSQLDGFQINIEGNFTSPALGSAQMFSGSTKFVFNGTGSQTWTGTTLTYGITNDIEINKPSGTLVITGNIKFGDNNFKHVLGAVDASASTLQLRCTTSTIDAAGMEFGNIRMEGVGGGIVTLLSDWIIGGNLLISTYYGAINGADIYIKGNYTDYYTVNGNGTVRFVGTGSQVWSSSDTIYGTRMNVEINKPSGVLTLGALVIWGYNGSVLTYVTGTVDPSTSIFRWVDNSTINASGMNFYTVQFRYNNSVTLADQLNVLGDLCAYGSGGWVNTITGSQINLKGSFIPYGNTWQGNTVLEFNGTGSQIWEGTGTYAITTRLITNVNKISGTLYLGATDIHHKTGAITHINGLVDSVTYNNYTHFASNLTLDTDGMEWNRVYFDNYVYTLASDFTAVGTMQIYTLTDITFNGSDLIAKGDFIKDGDTYLSIIGSSTLKIMGNATQNIEINAALGSGLNIPLIIDKSGGVATLTAETHRILKSVTIDNGIFGLGAGTVLLSDNLVINGGELDFNTASVTFSGTVTCLGGIVDFGSSVSNFVNTLTFNGATADLGIGIINTLDIITINSGSLDFNTVVWNHSGSDFIYISGTVIPSNSEFNAANNITSDGMSFNIFNIMNDTVLTNDLSAQSLEIMSGKVLNCSDKNIYISKDWTNSGGIFSVTTGIVYFEDNSQTSTVYGDNVFYGINCTVIDKRIEFEYGKQQEITSFVLAGSSGHEVILRSTLSGSQWILYVHSYISVDSVDVQDSDASLGDLINATHSLDSGNNLNWFFSGYDSSIALADTSLLTETVLVRRVLPTSSSVVEDVIWSDLHPDLQIASDGDVEIVKNINAVYASIENILRTIRGERVMMRNFGGNFGRLLFEPLNDFAIKSHMSSEFKETIETWEPRVTIKYFDVSHNSDNSELFIRMEFYVKGYDKVFDYSKVFRF